MEMDFNEYRKIRSAKNAIKILKDLQAALDLYKECGKKTSQGNLIAQEAQVRLMYDRNSKFRNPEFKSWGNSSLVEELEKIIFS